MLLLAFAAAFCVSAPLRAQPGPGGVRGSAAGEGGPAAAIVALMADIDARLAAQRGEERPCAHELRMQRVLPGSGPQQTLVRFHYLEREDARDPTRRIQILVRADVAGNVAARVFSKTYYFSGGSLLAAVVRPDSASPCGERRLYFRGGAAAASLRDAGGGCAERTVEAARFDADLRAEAKDALARAKEYLDAFRALLRVEDDVE